MSTPAGRILINNLTYHVSNSIIDTSHARRLLQDRVCVAAYDNTDEVEQTKCYPGTRTLILERMENWLAAPGNAGRLLTWLDGPMGAGKTALARTMAERASNNKRLLGIFIFRRGQAGRDDESLFIATLVYQITISMPDVRPYVEEQIHNDPSVLQQSLTHQLDMLILGPLRRMRLEHPDKNVATLPNLIIVDGLDECGADKEEGKEERQIKVLDLLHRLALSQDVVPFAILVHSRPERHIKNWFGIDPHAQITNRFTLDASYKPEDDIRFFVTQSFLKLLTEHPSRHLLPPNWPWVTYDPYSWDLQPLNAIEILVKRSSGQFIYAAIAIRFISSQHHRPDERLRLLLRPIPPTTPSSSDSPDAIMDSLYMQILDNTNEQKTVLKVLGFNSICSHSRYITLDTILASLSISTQEFLHCYEQLQSLVAWDSNGPFLNFYHSSLSEFLADPNRSRHWYINRQNHAVDSVLRILELFPNEPDITSQMSYLEICDTLCHDLPHDLNSYPHDVQLARLDQEITSLCNFPESTYCESVFQLLSQASPTLFFRVTMGMANILYTDNEFEKRTSLESSFLSHLATLVIEHHIQPHLSDSHQFARFLCWALNIPWADSEELESANHLPNFSFPDNLSDFLDFLMTSTYHKMIISLFSIPSEHFLNDALAYALENVGRTRLTIHHSGVDTLIHYLCKVNLSQRLWLCIMDCQEHFSPEFRKQLHEKIYEPCLEKNPFMYLHFPPPDRPDTNSGFDVALARCNWTANRDGFIFSADFFFLRDKEDYQILVPGVACLEQYTTKYGRIRRPFVSAVLASNRHRPARTMIPFDTFLNPENNVQFSMVMSEGVRRRR